MHRKAGLSFRIPDTPSMRTLLSTSAALLLTITQAQPGTLDASFGTGGEVLIPLGTAFDLMWDMAIQTDDKIVVVGGMGFGAAEDAVILRFNADGSVDNTFGTNGQVIWAGTMGADRARAVDIDANGRIVVAGDTRITTTETQMFILRLQEDGSFDNTFSSDGLLVRTGTVYDDGTYARDVVCQPDGNILVGGYLHYSLVAPFHNETSLWVCTSTGGTASVFGGGSVAGWDLYQDDLSDVANSMVVRNDGSIALGTASEYGADQRMGIVLFDSDGSLPLGFQEGVYDFTTADDYANSILLMPDGRFILAGGASYQAGMAAIIPTNGGLDPGFGTAGKVDIQLGSVQTSLYSALVQPWDKILVTGAFSNGTGNPGGLFLGRYNSDGTADTPFGTNGFATYMPGGYFGEGRAIGLQSDGRIVVGGNMNVDSDRDMFLARFENDLATGATTAARAPQLSACPNPFSGTLTVQGTSANGQLTLIDALGRTVLSARSTDGRTELHPADLPPGIYTFRYQHGDGHVDALRVVAE